MYILNITKAINLMLVKKIKDFICKKYHQRIVFCKKNCYDSMKHLTKEDLMPLANKLIKHIPDPRNAKEHYQSFRKKKNRKLVK